jgi:Spy/CpxP family protein refolding chaperone
MKKALIILALALAAGYCTFAFVRSSKETVPAGHAGGASLLEAMPELSWLRQELKLTDLQFKKVSALHSAYRPKCIEMCDRIVEAHERLERIADDAKGVTPELEAAISDHARIHTECQTEMLKHLYQTAALLDEEQAKLYLDTMLPT